MDEFKMPTAATVYQCPNCGATLQFDPDKQCFACEFCLSEFSESDLRASGADDAARREEEEGRTYCDQMQEYVCNNCGAEIVADANTAADFCMYCHAPILLRGKMEGQMRPHKLIPFSISRENAENRFLAFAKKKWFIPRGLFRKGKMEEMEGVYYPFWVTDADTDCHLEARATRVKRYTRGNTEYTETSYYDIHRRGDIHFEDITTSALSTGDKKMLEGILPFPSDALSDFSMPYLTGFYAKKRDIDREQLYGEVKDKMNRYANTILRRTVRDYDTVETKVCGVRVKNSHWEYSLMPVWIFSYPVKNKTFQYAMNGYTGKIYGKLPVSPGKLAILGAIVFAVAGLLTGLITALMMAGGVI